MAIIIDPERREIEALKQAADWRGARVLPGPDARTGEIGCGDGRLTLRLAQLGARVTAFDPDRALIRQARRNLPKRWAARVKYYAGSAEVLKHRDESFDRVVFAWSL